MKNRYNKRVGSTQFNTVFFNKLHMEGGSHQICPKSLASGLGKSFDLLGSYLKWRWMRLWEPG